MSNKFCRPEYRDILAAIVKHDPGGRAAVRHMHRLGATNMRPDYVLFRTSNGYDRAIDPTAWYAECRGGIFVCMVRHGNNDWSLHS
jgi:hypothetical protein